MDSDRALHRMEPVSVGWDLQALALIPHGLVVGDDALFLDPQPIGQTGPHPRHNRGARFRGGPRNAPVGGGDDPLAEKLIRGSHVRDARLRQLVGQSLVPGAEDTFRSAPRFRRIGGNQRDAQLRYGALHGCQSGCSDRPPSRLGVPVVRAAIGLQGTEQTPRLDHLPPPLETAPFFLDEEGRRELGGRIIQGRNQIPLTARPPLMRGAVLVEHHPRQRCAGSLLAMRAAPGRADDLALGRHPLLRPGVGATPAMVRLPALVEMFDRPPRGAGRRQGPHLPNRLHRDSSGGGPPESPIRSPFRALGFVADAPPTKRPFRAPEPLRRFEHRQFPSVSSRLQCFTSHRSHLLEDPCPRQGGPP